MTDQPELTPTEQARATRRTDILDHLRTSGSHTVTQLCDDLHLTEKIIRADLKLLVEDGTVGVADGDPPLNARRYFAAAQEA